MDPAAIRTALATALRTVVDDAGAQLEASPFAPDALDPPWAYPGQMVGEYDQTMGGLSGLTVTVKVMTSRAEDQRGQELLDAFLADAGPTSIKAAIEADPTLGGECADLHVAGWDGYQTYEIAGAEYYGAELTVVVYA